LVYERPLWFGNCAANVLTVTAVGLLLSGIFFALWGLALWWRALHPAGQSPSLIARHLQSRETTYLVLGSLFSLFFIGLFALSLTSFFPPEVARLAFANDKVEVKLCDGLFERRHVLARREVAYTYQEQIRGAKRIADRFLVLTNKSSPLGSIDLDRREVNLLAVRELAPAVARAHEVSVARAAGLR
jgi:hypothetical protein